MSPAFRSSAQHAKRYAGTGSGYLSRAEFDRRHRARINSPEWKAFVRALKIKRRFHCAVCGLDYLQWYSKWQLIGDHKRYRDASGRLIFGHETEEDVRLVCPECNRKGVRTDSQVKSDREAYLLSKALWWVVTAPFRLVWKLVRSLWRCVSYAPRRVD